jgi:hypothetical protein
MDGTTVDTPIEERRHECPLMSSDKVQKLVRKTRRSRGRNAKFSVSHITVTTEHVSTSIPLPSTYVHGSYLSS